MVSATPNHDWDVTCNFLGIGQLRTTPIPVVGGLLHRMWRVETEQGKFAVKVLSPEIMARPDAKKNYRLSDQVARLEHAGGVHAVTAKMFGEDPWLELNSEHFMVFDWVEGETLRPEQCTIEHAWNIGTLLFQIHQLDIKIVDLVLPAVSAIPEETWRSHLETAGRHEVSWGVPYSQLADDVIAWSRLYVDAAERTRTNCVVSHRDLDPKNVIWTAETIPYVIDWESAGYVHPTVELMEVGVNWSQSRNGTVNKERFQSIIRAYLGAGGSLLSQVSDALYGTLGGMLGWLEYNMRRSLDRHTFSIDESELGSHEVSHTLQSIKQFTGNLPQYSQWVEETTG